jgi:hypothetical protein
MTATAHANDGACTGTAAALRAITGELATGSTSAPAWCGRW